jgi:hypothetical protein
MQITCADGDRYSPLFKAGLAHCFVEVELNDGRKMEGYVTRLHRTRPRLSLSSQFVGSADDEWVEYDDIKTLVVL